MLELGSIALFVLLAAWGLWRLIAAAQLGFFVIALVAIPIAWLAADLLSGLAHWAFDTFGSTHSPLIGDAVIRPFRAHQPDHWPKNYGTVKFQPPETYLGQLFYLFRRKGKATPYG